MKASKGSRGQIRTSSMLRRTTSAAVMKTCLVLALFLMAGVSLGDIQKRITGGRTCTAAETRHFVFLETTNNVKRSKCSGSVIGSGNWVLTAAHCDAYKTPFTVKDVNKASHTSIKTVKHPSADLMLLKLNVQMKAIALATTTDCTNVKNQLAASKAVKIVIAARDTNGAPDTAMCGDIELRGCGQEGTTGAECFYGNTISCQTCGGDSGAGYLYNSALYAVHSGEGTVGSSPIRIGASVCDNNIRQWIDDTMKKN